MWDGGTRSHRGRQVNVAFPPEPKLHETLGCWSSSSLVATVRKLLELLPQYMDDCQGYVYYAPWARLLPDVISVPSVE